MSKLLIICNSATGLYDFRGMLIQQLFKAGYEIHTIVPDTIAEIEIEAEKSLKEIGCTQHIAKMDRRGMNPLKDISLFMTYIGLLRHEKPDMVITYTIKPNVYGGAACRLLGFPYAVNVTGLGTAFQGQGFLRKMVTAMYQFALKKAKVVFFENAENMQVFLNGGIIKKEQAKLLNGAGVNLQKFSVLPYPEDSEETRFLFIGRVMAEKGVDELFAAMRMLRADGVSCSLDMLGGFDEDYEAKIKEAEQEGWLRYHGYQSDVRPFIQQCHCFVLPSWHEGMANTNLECAASGRPVITSNIHGCLEAVEDGVTGYLCEAKNSDDLYRIMKRFCALSRMQRMAMGLAGRKRMEEIFDKKKVIAETIESLKR